MQMNSLLKTSSSHIYSQKLHIRITLEYISSPIHSIRYRKRYQSIVEIIRFYSNAKGGFNANPMAHSAIVQGNEMKRVEIFVKILSSKMIIMGEIIGYLIKTLKASKDNVFSLIYVI